MATIDYTKLGLLVKLNKKTNSTFAVQLQNKSNYTPGLRVKLDERRAEGEVNSPLTFGLNTFINRKDFTQFRTKLEKTSDINKLGLLVKVQQDKNVVNHSFATKLQVRDNTKIRTKVERQDPQRTPLRVKIEDTLIRELNYIHPHLGLFPQCHLSVKLQTRYTTSIRTKVEDIKQRTSPLRVKVEDTLIHELDHIHPHLGLFPQCHLSTKLQVRTKFPFRTHLENTEQEIGSSLRVKVEETLEDVTLHNGRFARFGLYAFVHEHPVKTSTRTQIERIDQRGCFLRALVEESSYPGVPSGNKPGCFTLRVQLREEPINFTFRTSIQHQKYGVLSLRVNVEETEVYDEERLPLKDNSLGLRAKIQRGRVHTNLGLITCLEESKTVSFGNRYYISITEQQNQPTRVDISREAGKDLPLGVNLNTQTKVDNKYRVQVDNREIDLHQLKAQVDKREYGTLSIRPQIQNQETGSTSIRSQVENIKIRTIKSYVQLEETVKDIKSLSSYVEDSNNKIVGLRTNVIIPTPTDNMLSMRTYITPHFLSSEYYSLKHYLAIRMGKVQGYAWVEYSTGIKDDLPVSWKIEDYKLEIYRENEDGTIAYITTIEKLLPNADGKFKLDDYVSLEFNRAYVFKASVLYTGGGEGCHNQPIGRIEKDFSFFLTPSKTELAYTIDDENLAILLEI